MKVMIEVSGIGFCPVCATLMEFVTSSAVGEHDEYWQTGCSCEQCELNVTYVAPNDKRQWHEYADCEIEIFIESFDRVVAERNSKRLLPAGS